MTDFEALSEVVEDLPRLQRSADRWAGDYFKIRRKLKISRNQPFLKKYPSTYKNKNPWVTVMFKPEEDERVKFMVSFYSYTSYYSAKGLRVFALAHNQVSVYNGHLFGRYNERLNLGIGTASDRVDHFFANNRVLAPSEFERDGVKTLVGICPLGYILGEQRQDLDCSIYKTFIARSTAGPRLDDLRQDLLNALDAFQPDQGSPNTTPGPTPDSLKTRLRLALEGVL